MKHLKILILISYLLVVLNCKTTPPLQFQENKQVQVALRVVGSKSSTINTEKDDINEDKIAYINMDEKTFINLLNANFNFINALFYKLSLIEGIWLSEKNTYKIGIQKAKEKGRYIAFILNSQEPTMKKGEIIAEFFETRDEYIYSTEYYLKDKTKIVTKGYIEHGMLLILLKKWGEENVFFLKEFPKKESTEEKEKVKESFREITKPRNEFALLKEKDDTQKIKQNNDTIEASSDKDDKNIVQAMPDKNIDNTINLIKKLKLDSQYVSRTIYTIQIGSFLEITRAHKQFDSMLQILNEQEFSALRIEKIGKYYTVRLGRFTDYNAAEQFIISAKPNLSNTLILETSIREERIIRFNAGSVSVLNETR